VPHLTPAAWDDPVVQQLTCAPQIERRDRHDVEPGAAERERLYVVPAARVLA
jgi:hypothetical protein